MFNNIFGIHEQALLLHGQRIGVLATNLANADTPNYKARDIDFSAVLAHTDGAPLPLAVTQENHIGFDTGSTPAADLKYRNPYQASLDGNTKSSPALADVVLAAVVLVAVVLALAVLAAVVAVAGVWRAAAGRPLPLGGLAVANRRNKYRAAPRASRRNTSNAVRMTASSIGTSIQPREVKRSHGAR